MVSKRRDDRFAKNLVPAEQLASIRKMNLVQLGRREGMRNPADHTTRAKGHAAPFYRLSIKAVSYTHLDVYKRQQWRSASMRAHVMGTCWGKAEANKINVGLPYVLMDYFKIKARYESLNNYCVVQSTLNGKLQLDKSPKHLFSYELVTYFLGKMIRRFSLLLIYM